jgi:hypothetical protein
MAQGNQTKAERRQARAAAGKPERKKQAQAGGKKQAQAGGKKQAQAGGQTKAERKAARAGRKPGAGAAETTAPAEDASPEERIEWRLARIEEAVAAQSERSDELLDRINEVLDETAQTGSRSTSESNAESD